MSFWSSPVGEITGKEEDAFAKNYVQIPDNTKANAKIVNFVVDTYANDHYVIEWELTNGDFKGGLVRQKLKVFDNDDNKKHRALNMMKRIYDLANIKPAHNNSPTTDELKIFSGKEMCLLIKDTPPNAEGKVYNWVSQVHPKNYWNPETGVSAAHETVKPAQPQNDSDVPF